MNELLSRRPDRPLPRGHHEQLRADLLATIESEQPTRRHLVPLVAAAAVFVVVAGLAVAVPALRSHDQDPAVAGTPSALATKDLSAAETNALRAQCEAEANRVTSSRLPHPFSSYKVLRAIEISAVKNPKIVNTWLIGRGTERIKASLPNHPNAPDHVWESYWLCSRTAGGTISESSIRFPVQANLAGPIQPFARNGGVYLAPVARVTVQPAGKPAVEAVLAGGFWFAPTEGRTIKTAHDEDDPAISDYTIRAYDDTGKQIFASTDPVSPECRARDAIVPGTTWPSSMTTIPFCPDYRWGS